MGLYHSDMLPELGNIGSFVLRTYTLLLDLVILGGLGVLAWQGQRHTQRPVDWVDAGLSGVVGGIVLGRGVHVAIYWNYFVDHKNEIVRVWQGGLDWHGALAGGLIFIALYCQLLPRIRFRQISDVLAVLLPVGAVFIYAGCLSTSCGHGYEVLSLIEYPAWMIAELPDLYGVVAPRLNTQLFGVLLSLLLFIISLVTGVIIRREGVRFWLILALLGGIAFGLGYTRGDAVAMLGTLRLDQMLDLLVIATGIAGVVIASVPQPAKPDLPDISPVEGII